MSEGERASAEKRRSLPVTLLLITGLLALFVWRSGELGPPEVASVDDLVLPIPVVSHTATPREGYFSPDFEAQTLDGAPVHLLGMRGKAVFLNFWAPWCEPCRAEMASIGRLAEAASGDIGIVTIAINSDRDAVERFSKEYKIGFPVIHDSGGDLRETFQVVGIPTTLVLDARGVVARRITGPRSWDDPDFVLWLSKLAASGVE
jgi:thiol-disulfide isomerase/thioredoxin